MSTPITATSAPLKSVVTALEYARAFDQVAAFLAANPDLAERAMVHLAEYTHICVGSEDDPAAVIVDAARRGCEAGASVEEYANDKYGGVKIHFGPLYVDVFADASRVCSKVVVGTVEDARYALVFDLDGSPRTPAGVTS
ncbi:hypothetical protein [Nonomuraea typhae]|uniref:Nuclear transport factor 2 family protein n=1 Tax=Nonomuraea typhae TaxID=2603600 RepID=A0ABW7YLQ8_9ACTN